MIFKVPGRGSQSNSDWKCSRNGWRRKNHRPLTGGCVTVCVHVMHLSIVCPSIPSHSVWGHTRGFDILIFNIPRVGLIFQAKSPITDLMFPGTLTHVMFVVYKSLRVYIYRRVKCPTLVPTNAINAPSFPLV